VFDSHAHLCDEAFANDLDEVIARARLAGVRGVVAVGETLADARANIALADRYPSFVWPAAGLFPTRLDLEEAERLCAWIRAHRRRLVAVGEVGLDYWRVQEPADRELQHEIFGSFVRLAQEIDRPLNVHSRSAGRATLELLLEAGATRVQMHAFDGRAAKAAPGVEAGYYFSVPPSIVRSVQKQKLVRALPLANLLLETDSPVLGADRAERNEPARVTVSLAAIAELKELPIDAVREAVAESSELLYRFRQLRAPSAR